MGFQPTLNSVADLQPVTVKVFLFVTLSKEVTNYSPWTCAAVDWQALLKILTLGEYHPSTIVLGFPKNRPMQSLYNSDRVWQWSFSLAQMSRNPSA